MKGEGGKRGGGEERWGCRGKVEETQQECRYTCLMLYLKCSSYIALKVLLFLHLFMLLLMARNLLHTPVSWTSTMFGAFQNLLCIKTSLYMCLLPVPSEDYLLCFNVILPGSTSCMHAVFLC